MPRCPRCGHELEGDHGLGGPDPHAPAPPDPVVEPPEPAPPNPVIVPPVEDPTEWTRRLEYYRWSCDQLRDLLEKEKDRWVRREAKTAQAFALAAAAGVVAITNAKATFPGAALFSVAGTLAVVVALLLTARILVVSERFTANPESHADDDGTPTADDWLTRSNRVRLNLLEAIRAARQQGEEMATKMYMAQMSCLIAVLWMIATIVAGATMRKS